MEKWREGEGGKVVYAVVVQVNETKLLHTMSIYIYFNETLRCFDFSKQSFGPSPSLYSINTCGGSMIGLVSNNVVVQ